MNSKIDKVAREIEKTRAKIMDDQAKLKELERQKTDLENTEIVTLFRSADITPGELAAVIRAYKENGKGAPSSAPAPAPEYPRSRGYNSEPEEQEDNTDE